MTAERATARMAIRYRALIGAAPGDRAAGGSRRWRRTVLRDTPSSRAISRTPMPFLASARIPLVRERANAGLDSRFHRWIVHASRVA